MDLETRHTNSNKKTSFGVAEFFTLLTSILPQGALIAGGKPTFPGGGGGKY